MFRELILRNRSIRRFYEDESIPRQTLLDVVDLARCSASGANLQPLKYLLAVEPAANRRIFPHLAWAGYLENWPGPSEGERPAAYIVILGDRTIRQGFGCDHGIAAQSILLGAAELGIGGCMIGSIQRVALQRELAIPDAYEILLVLALGRPRETVVLEPLGPDGSIKYWRDTGGVHHVPKRPLAEVVLGWVEGPVA